MRSAFVFVCPLVLLPAPFLLGACAGHSVAEKGREIVLGMTADAFQACAGIPTRTKQLDPRTELLSYEIKNENTGGVQITAPIVGGGFKLGSSGSYCHAIVRVVDGRVAEVNYTGDNDDLVGKEGVCAPIMRGCLRASEKDAEVRTAHKRD